MIYPGLCSVTFRQFSIQQVVELASRASLRGIEWAGDVHVPPGEVGLAQEARKLTEQADLQVAAYGSYYRKRTYEFQPVLDVAVELGAPTIRIWCGPKGSQDATAADRAAVVDDLCRIAESAATEGISISLEYHSKTLTDTIDSADLLFEDLLAKNKSACGNIFSYWQMPTSFPEDDGKDSLRRTLRRLSNLHVFSFADASQQKLSAGKNVWRDYFDMAENTGRDHYALLEFVCDHSPEAFAEDAATLIELLPRNEVR